MSDEEDRQLLIEVAMLVDDGVAMDDEIAYDK